MTESKWQTQPTVGSSGSVLDARSMQVSADALVIAGSDFVDDLVKSRERLGLTQEDVAVRLVVDVSVVQRIEAHGMDERLSTLRRYALALGVTYKHQVLPVEAGPTETI